MRYFIKCGKITVKTCKRKKHYFKSYILRILASAGNIPIGSGKSLCFFGCNGKSPARLADYWPVRRRPIRQVCCRKRVTCVSISIGTYREMETRCAMIATAALAVTARLGPPQIQETIGGQKSYTWSAGQPPIPCHIRASWPAMLSTPMRRQASPALATRMKAAKSSAATKR
jgi:hypothetical protein